MTKALGWILPIVIAISGCGGSDSGGGSVSSPNSVTVPKVTVSIQISWTPPTLYTAGSLFNDLSKCRVYYGPGVDSFRPDIRTSNYIRPPLDSIRQTPPLTITQNSPYEYH